MKGMITDLKRFAVHDGDGIRTTVFFKGCPLRCVWCHNPEGLAQKPRLAYFAHKCISCGECVPVCPQAAQKMHNGMHFFERDHCIACGKCANGCLGDALQFYGKEKTVEELLPLLLEDRPFYETSGGGVTLSGGECLMQADFCAALLRALKTEGVATAVDTCGFVPQEALDKVIPYTDVFLYDVKAYHEDVHLRCTGQSNKQILENLRYLNARGCKIEVRVPFVPDLNESEMPHVAALLRELDNVVGVRILPYHNFAGSKYEALGIAHTLPDRLPTEAEAAAVAALFDKVIH